VNGLAYALKRLREPSTLAGLSVLAALAGRSEAAQALQVLSTTIPDVIAAGLALAAALKPDPKPDTKP
jgi:hypothetical protein